MVTLWVGSSSWHPGHHCLPPLCARHSPTPATGRTARTMLFHCPESTLTCRLDRLPPQACPPRNTHNSSVPEILSSFSSGGDPFLKAKLTKHDQTGYGKAAEVRAGAEEGRGPLGISSLAGHRAVRDGQEARDKTPQATSREARGHRAPVTAPLRPRLCPVGLRAHQEHGRAGCPPGKRCTRHDHLPP